MNPNVPTSPNTPDRALEAWSVLDAEEREYAIGYLASIAPRAVREAAEITRALWNERY